MLDWLTLHIASLVVVALLFGAMACFGGLITPLVFKYMERAAAAAFLERVFPVYYRSGAITAIVAAAPLLPGRSYGVEMVILLAVSGTFLFAARFLAPAVAQARQAGDQARFAKLHGSSVVLHLIQLLGVTVVLVRLAQ